MVENQTPPLTPHTALIYTMITVSAADREMTDKELLTIGEVIRALPAFEEFDEARLPAVAAQCADILSLEDGLDTLLEMVAASLPERLRETAYALACEVAAADREIDQEELRLLEILRDVLEIDRLAAAAIERGVRARHARA